MLIILIVLMVSDVSSAASESKIRITQVEANLPDITLFVQLENINMDRAKLKKNLSIKINNTPTQITDIQSVKKGSGVPENTAYLVLVDTSVSMRNQLSELQILLEELLGFSTAKDTTAVFGVSNSLQTIKDFVETDALETVIKSTGNAISSGSKTGTYLYSGIREAYDEGRTAPDIPARRIIVLITDGGVDGDCLSRDELKNYLDVDRLPVYTLILNQQASVDEEFKDAADQIAQKTGGQSFISTRGNELFDQFKASMEKGSVIRLRCDSFKAFNLQADLNLSMAGDQGEIKETAKFTATPAPKDMDGVNNQQNLKTSYYGVAVILIPMILSLFITLAAVWLLMNRSTQPGLTPDSTCQIEKGELTNSKVDESRESE